MDLSRSGWRVVVLVCVAACGEGVVEGDVEDDAARDLSEVPDAAPADGAPWQPCAQFEGLCGDAPVDVPTFGAPTVIVPSAALPPQVTTQLSNNNVDATWFESRLFVAFRTASHHHPRGDARLYVVSTDDLHTWRLELELATGEDLREPQLVVLGGRLALYYTAVEPVQTAFRPIGVRVMWRTVPERWSGPAPILEPGLVAWRINVVGETAYLTGYAGLDGLLDFDTDVRWFRSDDGLVWIPVDPASPAIFVGGSTESDFVFLDDGEIVAVLRNDFGDADGFGSKLCRLGAGFTAMTCAPDRRKFDSPRLFRHADDVYLIGRRNVTSSGFYDLGLRLPRAAQVAAYMADYWLRPKRCALWRVDPTTLEVAFVLDLPSRGDTCFAEVLPLNERQLLVLNYTSPLDGDDDPSWREAQGALTLIYLGVLDLPAP